MAGIADAGHYDSNGLKSRLMAALAGAGLLERRLSPAELAPGGRFATYDVVAGSGEALHFPVPWSAGPDTSFLLRPDAMREMLERQGFRIHGWVDQTADAVAWVCQQQARAKAGVSEPTLGLHLAMGPDFPQMPPNLGRNLLEGRVGIQQAVLVRT